MTEATPIPPALEADLHRLVDEYRTRCLWFLRPDHYPSSTQEALRVLRQIERNADRTGFVRAATFRQWLSASSSERSVAS